MFNLNALRWWCNTPEARLFDRIGVKHETSVGNYSFINRDSNVLAVAHLDTALNMKRFHAKENKVYSPSLDDRLGAYVIVDVLPKLGVNVDVLLTDGEEKACSTAMCFDAPKKYNWIVSFDRRGADVVMYSYENREMADLMESFDFKVGWGSFSDICWLDNLGCKAFNIGVGYKHEHSAQCCADLQVTKNQVLKFVNMYHAMNDTLLPHDELDYKSSLNEHYAATKSLCWDDQSAYEWYYSKEHEIPKLKKDDRLYDFLEIDEECIKWEGHLFVCYDYERRELEEIIDEIMRGNEHNIEYLWEYYVGEESDFPEIDEFEKFYI